MPYVDAGFDHARPRQASEAHEHASRNSVARHIADPSAELISGWINTKKSFCPSTTRLDGDEAAQKLGLNGEIEYAAGLVQTLQFGNEFRKTVKATLLSINFSIPDAPGPDEIIVVLGAADGGRSTTELAIDFVI